MSQPLRTSNWKLAQFLWLGLGYDLTGKMAGTQVVEDVYGDRTVFFLFEEDLAAKELSLRYREVGNVIQDLIRKSLKESI